MVKSRFKFLLALVLFGCINAAILGTLVGIGRLLSYFGSGADPASALKLVPTVPLDLKERVNWLPDFPSAKEGRELDPYTRDQIAGTYLRAWAQWDISYALQQPYGLKTYFARPALDMVSSAVTSTVSAGWRIRQSSIQHTLQLAFYAGDGSLVAFTDQNAYLVQQIGQSKAIKNKPPDLIQESNHVFAVVMQLEDGNWRVRDLVRRGAGPLLDHSQVKRVPATGFVQTQDRHLFLDGKLYTVVGVNYYPQAAPWAKFWPEYKTTQTKADLALIRQLGLNTVRIFIPYADFGGDKVDPLMLEKLQDFLDQAQAQHLKVIVTLFDNQTDHNLNAWSGDDRHLAGLIPRFATHPAILAWDLKNEPNLDYGANTQALTDAWLRHIARTVRRYDANHLLTIGWYTPEAAAALTDVVDLVAFHYAEPSATYGARLATLLKTTADKPVLLEEFTMSSWNSYWPNGHSEQEQALYYADLLRQQRIYATAGYLVWTLHDFDMTPLTQYLLPAKRAEANMGVVRRDGALKPAAAVIKPGASLDLAPLPRWYRFTKPFWRLVFGGSVMGLGFVFGVWWWWQRRRRTNNEENLQ